MKLTQMIAATAFVAILFPAAASATTATSVKDMPDGGQVTLSGTVEDFDSQHSFVLQDASGTVKIDLTSMKPTVLKEGTTVDVIGNVHSTLLGTDVVAQSVSENKGLGQKVGEAIDSLTGQDAASAAQNTTIHSLPKSGLVKVNGIVDNVYSGKKFTLKDSTGSINVAIKSGESASLSKGTEVTVVGNVDSGLLGKSIDATEVNVLSSDAPLADQ